MKILLQNTPCSAADILQGLIEYYPHAFIKEDNKEVVYRYSPEELISCDMASKVLGHLNWIDYLIRSYEIASNIPYELSPFNYPMVRKVIYHFEFKDGVRVPDEYIDEMYPPAIAHAAAFKRDVLRRLEECRILYNDLELLLDISEKDLSDKIKAITSSEPFPKYRQWVWDTYGPTVGI